MADARPGASRRISPDSGLFVALLAALMTMTAMSIDISLPAVPATAASLGASLAVAQLIVPAFFLGFAIGQTLWGPTSDRFGRRPVLLLGIVLYVVATLGCAVSPTMELLLVLRVVQGIGAGAGSILSRTIIRDLFQGADMARVMSLTLAAFITAPIVAPTVGALILTIAPWRGIFVFLAVYGVALLALTWVYLEESLPVRNPRALSLERMAGGYRAMFGNTDSRAYAIAVMFVFATLTTYLTNAPSVFMQTYKVSPSMFGLIFAIVAACSAAGNLINARIVHRLPLARVMAVGLAGAVASMALNLVVAILGHGGPWGLVPGFAGFFFFFGFIAANGTTLALMPHRENVGAAISALGVTQTIVPAVVAASIAALYDGTAHPTAIGMLLLMLASGTVFFLHRRSQRAPGHAVTRPSLQRPTRSTMPGSSGKASSSSRR